MLLHQWCTPLLAWVRTLWGRWAEGKEDRYGSGSARLLMNFSHACWHSRCQMGIDCTHARQPACEKRLKGRERMGGNRQVSILLSTNMPMFVLMVFIILLVHQSVQTAGMILSVQVDVSRYLVLCDQPLNLQRLETVNAATCERLKATSSVMKEVWRAQWFRFKTVTLEKWLQEVTFPVHS